jgi:hypothetical protein
MSRTAQHRTGLDREEMHLRAAIGSSIPIHSKQRHNGLSVLILGTPIAGAPAQQPSHALVFLQA